jgi:hypothetical protein
MRGHEEYNSTSMDHFKKSSSIITKYERMITRG